MTQNTINSYFNIHTYTHTLHIKRNISYGHTIKITLFKKEGGMSYTSSDVFKALRMATNRI
jgi:hypothetical protein